MIKKIIVISLAMLIASCASGSRKLQAGSGTGRVDTRQSSFDGATELRMKPAYVAPAEGGMAQLSVGFSWRSTEPDIVVVLVRVTTFASRSNISGGALNIDGQIIPLVPLDETSKKTDSFMLLTDKIFTLPTSAVISIESSKIAKIRVDDEESYRVGDFKAKSFGNVIVSDRLPAFIAAINKAREQ